MKNIQIVDITVSHAKCDICGKAIPKGTTVMKVMPTGRDGTRVYAEVTCVRNYISSS